MKKPIKSIFFGSAEVVGLMCLHIFTNGDKNEFHALEKPAKRLGSAFQKVNFFKPESSRKESKETYLHCEILKSL